MSEANQCCSYGASTQSPHKSQIKRELGLVSDDFYTTRFLFEIFERTVCKAENNILLILYDQHHGQQLQPEVQGTHVYLNLCSGFPYTCLNIHLGTIFGPRTTQGYTHSVFFS